MTAETLEPRGPAALIAEDAGERPWQRTLRLLGQRRMAVAGLGIVLFFIALAILAPLVSPYDPLATNWAAVRKPPSMAHLFGTDEIGRDLFSRVVYGASLTLRAALIAIAVGLVGGGLLGLLAGYIGGWVDSVLMRLVDVLLAIPALLLSLAIVLTLGFGLTNVAIAVGSAYIASSARVMRGEVLRIRQNPYVEAARVGGARRLRVLAQARIIRH